MTKAWGQGEAVSAQFKGLVQAVKPGALATGSRKVKREP